MHPDSFDAAEIRSTIKWYFESKNVSLRKALQIRGSLTTEQHNDLRVFYSQYLSSLVSGIEALLEKEYPFNSAFRDDLYKNFTLEGHPDGEQNYAYLKELRNAVIHRGEDIAGRGTLTLSGLPLLHVPIKIKTRNGKNTYISFSPLLLGIVTVCESFIGRLILQHFQKENLLQPRTDREAWIVSMQADTKSNPTIPEWVKQQLPNLLQSINLEQVEAQTIASLIQLLSSEHQELICTVQEIQATGQ
jgi:hypothetical protein